MYCLVWLEKVERNVIVEMIPNAPKKRLIFHSSEWIQLFVVVTHFIECRLYFLGPLQRNGEFFDLKRKNPAL